MVESIVLTMAMLAADSGVFVGAGIGAQFDNTWADADGSPAVLVTVGTDLSERIGIRLAVDVPGAVTTERGSTVGPDRVHITEEHRSIEWSGFLDIHRQVGERVRLGALVGLTYAQRPTTSVLSHDLLGAGNTVLAHTTLTQSSRYDWAGLAFGFEAPVRATSHLAIVPVGTVTLFPFAEYGRTSIARIGAETRWRF